MPGLRDQGVSRYNLSHFQAQLSPPEAPSTPLEGSSRQLSAELEEEPSPRTTAIPLLWTDLNQWPDFGRTMPEPGISRPGPRPHCPAGTRSAGPSPSSLHTAALHSCAPSPFPFFSLPPSPILLASPWHHSRAETQRDIHPPLPTATRQSPSSCLPEPAAILLRQVAGLCGGRREWGPSPHGTPQYPFCDQEHGPSPFSASSLHLCNEWGGSFLGLT